MSQARLPAPRAIIFDWDNTLVDSWPCIHAAMNETLVRMGHETWSLEKTQSQVALSLRNAFPALFGNRWEEARDIYLSQYAAIHMERLVPLLGAAQMLTDLREMGVHLAVVSNKTGRFLRIEADHLGWTPHFGRLVGAGDAATDKPSTAPVHMALDGTGIAPGPTVWFAGDAPVDMHCAIDSGCTPILLRSLLPGVEEFQTHPPRHHFAAFESVTGLVRGLLHPISC
ncbi:MAG TPA: HAD family hydrolase [Magnetospirillaceae bacterium]